MAADFLTLKWLASEVKMRSLGRTSDFGSARSLLCMTLRQASSRASSSAWKLDWLPPEVKMPSASGPRPMRCAVQSIRRRSMSVPPMDWSQVSREELTAERTASPSTAGMTTGQLRWPR